MRAETHRRDYLCQDCGAVQRLGSKYVHAYLGSRDNPNLVERVMPGCSTCHGSLTCLSYHQNIARGLLVNISSSLLNVISPSNPFLNISGSKNFEPLSIPRPPTNVIGKIGWKL